MLNNRIAIWSSIYGKEGIRWGMYPSYTAFCALPYAYSINKGKCRLLDVGCGYCRDSIFIKDFLPEILVDGIDASEAGLKIAREVLPFSKLRNMIKGDYLKHDFDINYKYNILYANYFIHLLVGDEIKQFFDKSRDIVNKNGNLIFSAVSIRDKYYGKGNKVHDNTFQLDSGLPWHFFTEEEIIDYCTSFGFEIVKSFDYIELELINGKPDLVNGIFIVAKRI